MCASNWFVHSLESLDWSILENKVVVLSLSSSSLVEVVVVVVLILLSITKAPEVLKVLAMLNVYHNLTSLLLAVLIGPQNVCN